MSYSKSEIPSIDYFNGYIDCLKNIKSRQTMLIDQYKYGGVKIDFLQAIGFLTADARDWEISMHSRLRETYGDRLKLTRNQYDCKYIIDKEVINGKESSSKSIPRVKKRI